MKVKLLFYNVGLHSTFCVLDDRAISGAEDHCLDFLLLYSDGKPQYTLTAATNVSRHQ